MDINFTTLLAIILLTSILSFILSILCSPFLSKHLRKLKIGRNEIEFKDPATPPPIEEIITLVSKLKDKENIETNTKKTLYEINDLLISIFFNTQFDLVVATAAVNSIHSLNSAQLNYQRSWIHKYFVLEKVLEKLCSLTDSKCNTEVIEYFKSEDKKRFDAAMSGYLSSLEIKERKISET